jgi:superfamily II DNA/RNA helicase
MFIFRILKISLKFVLFQYMQSQNFGIPMSIQAHAWPAILRGEHFAGILPPRQGKTTSYLLPLVSHLMKFQKYIKLSSGGGVSVYDCELPTCFPSSPTS